MRIIKKLAGMIDEEIDGAMEYARDACQYRDDYPEIARMWAELAEQELRHINRLHEAVVEQIEEARASGKTLPAGMMEMYEWIHGRQIERVNAVKNYIAQYKE